MNGIYKKFDLIEIDNEEISQAELNIDNKERSNLFNWNGQFSPQFIEVLLERYAMKKDIIYDPFAGSGTVLYEAGRKGLQAVGIELNPSAYYMSKFYELMCVSIEEREEIIRYIDDIVANMFFDHDYEILLVDEHINNNNAFINNTVRLLIILLDIENKKVNVDIIIKKWNNLKNNLLNLPFSSEDIKCYMGDSRKNHILNNTVSLVITSPPYINVFNYHQNYRKSVENLGYDVLNIAKKELGANRKHRGNRFYTVIQYCIDMALSINETIRICKDKATLIYVVGRESRVLGLDFYNSRLIYNIFVKIFNINLRIRQSRTFKNRFGKLIIEDVLHFCIEKENITMLSEEEIIRLAQEIGREELLLNIDKDFEEKNLLLLNIAINNYKKIWRSEYSVEN
ncbi:DNA methyltransferase [Exiguobacterium sp. MH3]|uniref:DNA methyltransferase n=1 Tax=Exiguobacterium sp. MH3 TaxID=1399115 RepID=UPI0003C3F780|nr:DNA methyltransferase [Exiguobacterium sp. MH3]AHA28759.1 methyltransferase [Exiguobacterium sp. MH3]